MKRGPSAKLLAQAGFLFLAEADRIAAKNHGNVPTEEEEHLTATARAIFDRARAAGFSGGSDAAFK